MAIVPSSVICVVGTRRRRLKTPTKSIEIPLEKTATKIHNRLNKIGLRVYKSDGSFPIKAKNINEMSTDRQTLTRDDDDDDADDDDDGRSSD